MKGEVTVTSNFKSTIFINSKTNHHEKLLSNPFSVVPSMEQSEPQLGANVDTPGRESVYRGRTRRNVAGGHHQAHRACGHVGDAREYEVDGEQTRVDKIPCSISRPNRKYQGFTQLSSFRTKSLIQHLCKTFNSIQRSIF